MKIKNNEILSEMLKESKMGSLRFRNFLFTIKYTMQRVGLFKERENEIFSMVLDGYTLEEIGKKYDLTSERIRQIFEKSLRRAKYALERYAKERQQIEEYKKRIEVLEAQNRALTILGSKATGDIPSTMRLRDLNFSVRALGIFAACEIDTLEDLINTSPMELLRYRGMGRKTLNEIRELMLVHNIDWK